MTVDRAKEILVCYRPGLDDGSDPELQEALQLCAQNAELQTWYEGQKRAQELLKAQFRAIEPPTGLREQILSERKAAEQLPLRRRLAATGVLALAGVIVAVILAFQHRVGPAPYTVETFQNRMAALVIRAYPEMDLETNNLPMIQQYLASKGAPSALRLGAPLADTPTTGCKVLEWREKPVSMVCFKSNPVGKPNTPDLFLFVTDAKDLAGGKKSGELRFSRVDDLNVLSWTADGKVYVLAGFADELSLRKFL